MRLLCLLAILLSPVSVIAQDSTWLVNVTEQVGLDSDSLYNFRIYVTDFNNDDYPDLLLQYGNWGQNQLRLFLNMDAFGNRVFADITQVSGINPPGRIADNAVVADFNNDGNVDIITNVWYHSYVNVNDVCIENPDTAQRNGSGLRILLGDGTGKFAIKENSGLESIPPNSGSGLPVLDYDRDGNLDLYVGPWYTGWCDPNAPGGLIPDKKYLLKGMGDGSFIDATASSEIEGEANYGLFGANVADFNNDCYPDIINTPYDVQGTGNVFQNQGNGTFLDVASAVGFDLHYRTGNNGQGMVPWEAMPYDFDSDGDIDFLVPFVHGSTSATRGKTCIYVNGGEQNDWSLTPDPDLITRKSPQALSGHYGDHKAIWWDIDNNGLVDLLISDGGYGANFNTTGERLHFCLQGADHKFTDVTKELGFIAGTSASTIDTIIKGAHAIEPIDYDLDGDDDLVAGMLYNPTHPFLFLKNDIGNKNNWLKVKLEAPAGVNKSAIGARIYVTAGGITQMRDIEAGQGHFGGQQSFILTFGLGDATTIDSVVVRWPDQNCSRTIMTNVPVRRTILVTKEGFHVIGAVGKDQQSSPSLRLFPNPAMGNLLTVKSELKLAGVVKISSVLGDPIATIDSSSNASNELQIPIDNLADGVYLFQLTPQKGLPLNSFFVINK